MQLDQLHVPPASRTVDGDPQQCREATLAVVQSSAKESTACLSQRDQMLGLKSIAHAAPARLESLALTA